MLIVMVISPARVNVAITPAPTRTSPRKASRLEASHTSPSANATSRNIDVMVG